MFFKRVAKRIRNLQAIFINTRMTSFWMYFSVFGSSHKEYVSWGENYLHDFVVVWNTLNEVCWVWNTLRGVCWGMKYFERSLFGYEILIIFIWGVLCLSCSLILFEKLLYVSKPNRYLHQSDFFFSWKIEFNQTYKWNVSAQNYMSEDVHSSTFPRVTDICANQVAPFLSRSRVFEKLKKWKVKK